MDETGDRDPPQARRGHARRGHGNCRHLQRCEPSNATVVVGKLESQRLIERRPHPSDRRAKQLILTPDGTELRERLLELLNEESPVAGLTQQEQGALQGLLQRAISRR